MKWLGLFYFILIVVLLPVDGQDAEPEPFIDAVTAEFTASLLTPLVGQPLSLTFRVIVPPNAVIVELPEFDWDMPFMLLNIGEMVTENSADGGRLYQQVLDVRLWEPGDHQTPETFVRYQIGDEVFSVPVRPVFFSVPTVLESGDLNVLELRPLKSQIEFFYVPPLVALVGVLLLFGVIWFGQKQYHLWRLRLEARNRVIPTPEQVLRASLVALQAEVAHLDSETIYLTVAERLRAYLYAKDSRMALDLTTTELLYLVRQSELLGEQMQDDIDRLLSQTDLVKFAQHHPGDKAAAGLVRFALHWLDTVEAAQQPVKTQDDRVGQDI